MFEELFRHSVIQAHPLTTFHSGCRIISYFSLPELCPQLISPYGCSRYFQILLVFWLLDTWYTTEVSIDV